MKQSIKSVRFLHIIKKYSILVDLKFRIKEALERKLGLKNINYLNSQCTGSGLEPLSVFNTIRRMKIIYRLFSDTNDKHFDKI